MSDWVQRSVHRCTECGHFLNLKLVKGEGWIACDCDRCGAAAPDQESLAREGLPPDADELITENLEDASVAILGSEGGWLLEFTDGGPAGACYSGEILVSHDSRPPFPEGFHGFISWAGDDLLIVDQDPINGTHHAHSVEASLPEWVRDLTTPLEDPEALRILAEHLYRSAYSASTKPLNP